MSGRKVGVVIVGGGLAGMVAALHIMEAGHAVTVIDRLPREQAGGLARTAFGGMALVGTREQKMMRVPDSRQQMLKDWISFGELAENDIWPRRWAEHYVERCQADVYEWVKSLGLGFMPAVNWVERGRFQPGNSFPRYHVLWGTGLGLVRAVWQRLEGFEKTGKLCWQAESSVTDIARTGSDWELVVCGGDGRDTRIQAENVLVATGGFTGNLERVRQEWPGAPAQMLNGSHPVCDGTMHDVIARQGGCLTHMQHMWNYAAGIAHPRPAFPGHGLSLIPPKSALWLDHRGERIGPEPLVTGFDTPWLCERVSAQEKPWTWQLLNRRIAGREISVSGAEHNPHIRDHRLLPFARDILLGNQDLVRQLTGECPDVVTAGSLSELCEKMNALTDESFIHPSVLKASVSDYDARIMRGRALWDDDQLRRIEQLRQWRTERLRTCRPRPILDPSGGPLIAMRLRLITRKSLGGIQTDLASRVLDQSGAIIPGLYAIGEAAGFGGGGASGKRSLEGTFLAGCILTAKQAARALGERQ